MIKIIFNLISKKEKILKERNIKMEELKRQKRIIMELEAEYKELEEFEKKVDFFIGNNKSRGVSYER